MGAAAGLFAKIWSPQEIKTRFSDIGKGAIEVEKGDITAQNVIGQTLLPIRKF